MSTAASQVISYQVSNKVPTAKDVRAYISGKVKAHTAAAAEVRQGTRKAAILTVNNVVRASTVVVDGKEVALGDLDDRGLDSVLGSSDSRPFFG